MAKKVAKKLPAYDHLQVEKKWQKAWAAKKVFVAKQGGKKKYILTEFPYPSGTGLHMGHLRGYIAGDVTARYWRSKGYQVLFPMGWDAFGLPAENYAIKNHVQPKVSTAKNIKNAKRQLESWGTSFDWSREINTTDPAYYRWTQWLFLQFFKQGLAYEAEGLINWCPKDKTGLANEEVVDGKCERCGTLIEKRTLRQWYLKITKYADSLVAGLKYLPEWPDYVKLQQENWIGKSEGSEIEFAIKGSEEKIKVFTTRADTLFGVTYIVLAPESPLIVQLSKQILNQKEVTEYIAVVKTKTDIDRTNENKEKTGVELKGIKAINPANGEEISVWIADYVLAQYGTGMVMAVPAHDDRDFAFAKKYNLTSRCVVSPRNLVTGDYFRLVGDTPDEDPQKILQEIHGGIRCYEGNGTIINSNEFNDLSNVEARKKITAAVGGKLVTTYKLRDWLFSRQRYWGEPIPLIHCLTCGIVSVPEKDLPVKLPEVKNYEPSGTGESPLAAISRWVNVKCPTCKGKAKRETNTMPQWAGSSWYWLRYADVKNKKIFADKKLLKYWTPVDVYFGGMEHTTLHLLYSRFWNQFLYDQKLVTAREPYVRRVPHGIILGPDGEKMSKSRGNVVNPDDIVTRYGADTLRVYMQFLAPHDMQVAWNDEGIIGARRFIERVWQLPNFIATKESLELTSLLHKTIAKVTADVENAHFNTAISAMMIFIKQVDETHAITKDSLKKFLKLFSLTAPHVAEEIWVHIGGKGFIAHEKWPTADIKKMQTANAKIVVQINGRVRGTVLVPQDTPETDVEALIRKDEQLVKWLIEGTIVKKIFIQNKIINFVVR